MPLIDVRLIIPYRNLEPGGYLEMQDFSVPYESDDGTLTPEHPVHRSSFLAGEAAKVGGRPMTLAPEYRDFLQRAGFVDIVERRFKWPINTWPKDPYYKQIGAWVLENLDGGVEGLLMALFTRFLGWSREEVLVFSAQVRESIKDRRVHAYIPM